MLVIQVKEDGGLGYIGEGPDRRSYRTIQATDYELYDVLAEKGWKPVKGSLLTIKKVGVTCSCCGWFHYELVKENQE